MHEYLKLIRSLISDSKVSVIDTAAVVLTPEEVSLVAGGPEVTNEPPPQ